MDATASVSTHLKYMSTVAIKNFLIPDVDEKGPRISIHQVANGHADTMGDNSVDGVLEDLANS